MMCHEMLIVYKIPFSELQREYVHYYFNLQFIH